MTDPHYSISTPENVDLHLELAGLGSRIWAAFIDFCLIYLLIIGLVLIALVASILLEQSPLSRDSKTLIYYWVIGLSTILLSFSIQFAYFIYFEKIWNGQTPGKRIAQIRVIEANGQPVNTGSVIIRNLLRIVDTYLGLGIGIVFMIFDRNERRIGDMAGGTLVIRERSSDLLQRNLKLTADKPESSFIDAGQISPDEYHLLLDFLKRRQKMESGSRQRLAKKLDDYFRQKLNPEKQENESSENFLEKVYLSYTDSSSI